MRGAGAWGSVSGATERVRTVSTRRKGTVKLIFMSVLAPGEVQRNGSCRSVVADIFHQGANEQTRFLFKRLPQGFRNIQLLSCPTVAQRCSKLIEDRIFYHSRRHRFSRTGVPTVLRRRGVAR